MKTQPFRKRHLLHLLVLCYSVVWSLAAVNPVKRNDWFVENLLVFIGVPVLVFTYRRLPLSDTSYVLIFLFLLLHAAGAHYTYAEVPFGYWLKNFFHWRRNHFDRVVHFSFGLLLTYPMRELLRPAIKTRGFWAFLLPVAVIVSLSGFFEIIEAVVATIVDPELGAAYLGIQGDVWDAQKDMALAVAGAALAGLFAAGIAWRRRQSHRESLDRK
jgi:putative membrane protein